MNKLNKKARERRNKNKDERLLGETEELGRNRQEYQPGESGDSEGEELMAELGLMEAEGGYTGEQALGLDSSGEEEEGGKGG